MAVVHGFLLCNASAPLVEFMVMLVICVKFGRAARFLIFIFPSALIASFFMQASANANASGKIVRLTLIAGLQEN